MVLKPVVGNWLGCDQHIPDVIGYSLGLTQIYTNPATGSKYVGLNYWVGLSCYFFLIFSIANFPPSKENSAPVV